MDLVRQIQVRNKLSPEREDRLCLGEREGLEEDGGTGCRKDYFFQKNSRNIVMAF